MKYVWMVFMAGAIIAIGCLLFVFITKLLPLFIPWYFATLVSNPLETLFITGLVLMFIASLLMENE